MPGLLSGSMLRTGGSGQFIKLQDAMPQLPASPSTSTGYSIITSDKLVTTYASSLGNIEFSSATVYSNNGQNIQIIATGTTTSIVVRGSVAAISTNTGALVVQGGVGMSGDLYVGGTFTATTSSVVTLNVANTATVYGDLFVEGRFTASTSTILTLKVIGTETSISTNTGALQVVGGVGIAKNLFVESTATFNTDALVNNNLTVKENFTVDGNGNVYLVPDAADVVLQPTLGGKVTIWPSATGNIDNMVIGENDARDGYFDTLYVENLTVTNTAWVGGSVYSQEGILAEDNLLYTPRSTLSIGSPPADPRLGDFWIDPGQGATFQYILDDVNKVWIQFTGL